MGPILGIATGTVREDATLMRSSISAEVLGVLLCVATAGLVSFVLTPASIDFTNHEISARTHPTLYCMAIGLAAGAAGAFATVNARISGSMAGVAIAVWLARPFPSAGSVSWGPSRTAARSAKRR